MENLWTSCQSKKINHQAEHGCTRALPRSPLPAWRVPLVAGVALLPGKPTRGPGRPRAGLGPGHRASPGAWGGRGGGSSACRTATQARCAGTARAGAGMARPALPRDSGTHPGSPAGPCANLGFAPARWAAQGPPPLGPHPGERVLNGPSTPALRNSVSAGARAPLLGWGPAGRNPFSRHHDRTRPFFRQAPPHLPLVSAGHKLLTLRTRFGLSPPRPPHWPPCPDPARPGRPGAHGLRAATVHGEPPVTRPE